MEITLLKALYINIGKEYANFSVGHFQMKPSFAEDMINKGAALRGRKPPITDSTGYGDIRNYRAAIVASLEDIHSQVGYLVVFYRLVYKEFDLVNMADQERIRFLATAYNYGPSHSKTEIVEMSHKKFFSTKLAGGNLYSYADISAYWYNHNTRADEKK